jgi:hypothetical protein
MCSLLCQNVFFVHKSRFGIRNCTIFLTCLLFGLRANATDSLDVEFIDKYYVTKPQQAYLLLKPTFERLQREGWKKTTRQRYERVAGYVCLANNYYAKAMQHALNLEDLNKKEGNDQLQLESLELQCAVLDELGQYEQLTRTLTKIHEIIIHFDDDDDHLPQTRPFSSYITLTIRLGCFPTAAM